jgi:hypothetical protein
MGDRRGASFAPPPLPPLLPLSRYATATASEAAKLLLLLLLLLLLVGVIMMLLLPLLRNSGIASPVLVACAAALRPRAALACSFAVTRFARAIAASASRAALAARR